ncbi:sulfurtransferase [Actinomycetospora flava]|uniref:Rhodanese-like domain-containing protein n=1 Tax=Actinomycetospora flava TaxID=3129232 RepID=A0ABU8M3E5_9PSEU
MREQVLVTPAELAASQDEVVVLDVTVDLGPARFDGDYRVASGRGGWERRHVPGSRHVDLLTELVDPAGAHHFAHPSRAELLAGLARLGVGDRRIVLYDEGRMQWAARAWWVLRCAGVASRVLDGGLAAWVAGGHPVEEGDAGTAPTPGAPPPVGEPYDGWADRDEVAAVSAGERPGTLVCALTPEQFAGTVPSRYARRGHIPGSRNLPAASLLTPERAVRPAALADAADPLVVYCGGGISACLTALGLTLAGHRHVEVYDGSLEEWAADPALPLVTSPGP